MNLTKIMLFKRGFTLKRYNCMVVFYNPEDCHMSGETCRWLLCNIITFIYSSAFVVFLLCYTSMASVWKQSESLVRLSVAKTVIPLSQGWGTNGTRAQNDTRICFLDTRHSLLSHFSLFLLPTSVKPVLWRICICVCIYIYIYTHTHTYLTAYRLYMNYRFY